jgi:hypothetical protein
MAIALSLAALAFSLYAVWIAYQSAQAARKMRARQNREALPEYSPSLYVWSRQREPEQWVWAMMNVGRRPAVDVALAPHWGEEWEEYQALSRKEKEERPEYAPVKLPVVPERAERRVSLPLPPAERNQVVLATRWVDPVRREEKYRCWLARREGPAGPDSRWSVDALPAASEGEPGCEWCGLRDLDGNCPTEMES